MPSEFLLSAQFFLALFYSAVSGASPAAVDADASHFSRVAIAKPDGSTSAVLLIPKLILRKVGMYKGKPESVQIVVDVENDTQLRSQLLEVNTLASSQLVLKGKRGLRPRQDFILLISYAKAEHAKHVAGSYLIKDRYIPDGEILGLQRFSYKSCPETGRPLDNYTSQMLKMKPDDDPSPPGCFVKRSVFMATNLFAGTALEDPMSLTCTHTSCRIWILVNESALSTAVRREEIPLARNIAGLIKSTYLSIQASEN